MEYVRLVYGKRRLIKWKQDNSSAVESDIITSMAKHRFPLYGRFVDWGSDTQTLDDVLGGGASQLHQPPFAYFLYASPLWLLSLSEIDVQLLTGRLVSVLLGSFIVLLAFWTSHELFPENEFLILGIPAFVLFLPTHTYMTSAVNNDHLAELIVSLQIFLIVGGFRRGFSISKVSLIALLIPIGLLTKRTVIYILPICAIAIPLYLWSRQRYRILMWGGLSALVLTLIAVPFAWPIGRKIQALLLQHARGFYTDYLAFWPPFSPEQDYFGAVAMHRYWSYIHIIFESFWGRFGWMNIRLASGWYWIVLVATLAAFWGLGRRFLGHSRQVERSWQNPILLLFASGIGSALIIIFIKQIRLWDYMPSSLPQGRYLFPLIIPVATLLVAGWEALIPERFRHLGLLVLLGGIMLLDTVSLIGYVIPFFYS